MADGDAKVGGCEWPAGVLADIRALPPIVWPHVGQELEHRPPRGYVYALTDDPECRRVYINWAGRTRLREQMARLQAGNPAQLRVVAILRRDNVYDAKGICETMHAGLLIRQVRGNWFEASGTQKIVDAFMRVDALVEH